MTVGELAAICGIPSAVTVAIVGFFVWLLERSIVKRETARKEEEAKLEAERTKQENSRKAFEKNLLATSNAALALGEATARAVQRIPDAHCNGDMHAALNYAAKIKHEQRDFLAAQGIDNIFEEAIKMAKIKDILANISNVKVGTWVRGILLIISLVNMALSAAGKAPIPADYNELYTIVSVVFSVLVGISAYWKNNSFTEAAQTADKYLHEQGSAIEDPGTDEEAE